MPAHHLKLAVAALLLGLLAATAAAQDGAAPRAVGRGGRGAWCRIYSGQAPPRNPYPCRAGLTCCNPQLPVFPKAAAASSGAVIANNFGGSNFNFTWGRCAETCQTGPGPNTQNCNRLLAQFDGTSTVANALIMSTLVADVTLIQAMNDAGRSTTDKILELRAKWGSYGADVASIVIKPFVAPSGPPGSDPNERAPTTYGAMFTAGSTVFVVVGWVIGHNENAEDATLVPFQDNADQQVRAVMYNYYQFIQKIGFFEQARTLAKDKDVVFAGLSAGAAVSQFAALEFTRVKGVFLFGVQRIGNDAFQSRYEAERGAVTSSWWNKRDAWPIVPVKDDAELALLPKDDFSGMDLTVDPSLRMLNPSFWWRVNPATSACERMTPALAQPCGVAGAQTCTLNVLDHTPKAHFDSIKKCAPATDACLNYLKLLS